MTAFSPLPSQSIEVTAAIIEKQGRFLITKRFEKSHLGHCWEFPGGKIHPGESLEACLIRECAEEIGVQINPLRKFKEVWHSYPGVRVHLHFYLCEITSGQPRPIECADLKWVKPEELQNFEFPEADHEIIQEIIQNRSR